MLWSPNCQLLYPFENQANDYSGNARHGTVFGSGVYATKPNGGRCLYFDGVGDYVATPSFGLSGKVVVLAADVRCKKQASYIQSFLAENAQSTSVGYIWCRRNINTDHAVWQYADGAAVANAVATDFFAAPYNDVWLHLVIACDYVGKLTYFWRNGIQFGAPVAMSGIPAFPATDRVRYIGSYNATSYLLTDGYLANVQLWTLATMPAAGQMLANVNRLMLGLNPIW